MTDTNGAKDETRLTPEDPTEHDTVVPASGGTFGVDGDQSGFGQRPLPGHAGANGAGASGAVDAQTAGSAGDTTANGAAANGAANGGTGATASGRNDGSDLSIGEVEIDPSGADLPVDSNGQAYDSSIDLSDIDRDFNADGNGASAVPADGGTFGVKHDESGYQSVDGHPNAAPYGDNFGAAQPGFGQGEFGAFSPPAETPAMAPPQYGAVAEAKSGMDTLAITGAVLGVLALLLMLLPSWSYMAGGVLGIIAVVLGAMRMQGPSRVFGILGVVTGCLAVIIAVATAVLVYVI